MTRREIIKNFIMAAIFGTVAGKTVVKGKAEAGKMIKADLKKRGRHKG